MGPPRGGGIARFAAWAVGLALATIATATATAAADSGHDAAVRQTVGVLEEASLHSASEEGSVMWAVLALFSSFVLCFVFAWVLHRFHIIVVPESSTSGAPA